MREARVRRALHGGLRRAGRVRHGPGDPGPHEQHPRVATSVRGGAQGVRGGAEGGERSNQAQVPNLRFGTRARAGGAAHRGHERKGGAARDRPTGTRGARRPRVVVARGTGAGARARASDEGPGGTPRPRRPTPQPSGVEDQGTARVLSVRVTHGVATAARRRGGAAQDAGGGETARGFGREDAAAGEREGDFTLRRSDRLGHRGANLRG
mmetsp:Transcript_9808/g.44661  ORF Transcript_9808/g.44661 Transcript_9808/m.44661 type:complete len:210 (-) Transcript_9808:1954-2583(-)